MLVVGTDIETTGLLTPEHRIIEFYGGLWDTKTGDVLTTLHKRINPERSIAAEAQRVHGISLSDLVSCPIWSDVAEEILEFLEKGELIIGHNGDGFDIPFLNQEFNRIGLRRIPSSIPTFDTMLEGRWATPTGKVPNLGELCIACDVEYDPAAAHAAHYDVDRMMDCFLLGLEWGFYSPALSSSDKDDLKAA